MENSTPCRSGFEKTTNFHMRNPLDVQTYHISNVDVDNSCLQRL